MFDFNFHNVIYEIYVNNQLVGKQEMSAPQDILIVQFLRNVDNCTMDSRPIKIKMIKQDIIYDKFKNKNIALDNFVEFSNNLCANRKE